MWVKSGRLGRFRYKGASCELEILAKEDTATPKTGESRDMILWIVLLLVSGGALGKAVYMKKKQLH